MNMFTIRRYSKCECHHWCVPSPHYEQHATALGRQSVERYLHVEGTHFLVVPAVPFSEPYAYLSSSGSSGKLDLPASLPGLRWHRELTEHIRPIPLCTHCRLAPVVKYGLRSEITLIHAHAASKRWRSVVRFFAGTRFPRISQFAKDTFNPRPENLRRSLVWLCVDGFMGFGAKGIRDV